MSAKLFIGYAPRILAFSYTVYSGHFVGADATASTINVLVCEAGEFSAGSQECTSLLVATKRKIFQISPGSGLQNLSHYSMRSDKQGPARRVY